MARKSKKNSRNLLLIRIVGVLILVAVVALAFHRPNKGSGQIPSTTPNQTASSSAKQPVSTPAATDKTSPTGSTTEGVPSNLSLLEPSGNFVSNHHPNLGGSPAPSAEQSVCNTTPGASCYIKFTKGDITKTLASQATDGNGSTYWNWDIKDSGFTEGSWQITATATLNGLTKSTTDSQDLVVQP
jgi:hypothetical protein